MGLRDHWAISNGPSTTSCHSEGLIQTSANDMVGTSNGKITWVGAPLVVFGHPIPVVKCQYLGVEARGAT